MKRRGNKNRIIAVVIVVLLVLAMVIGAAAAFGLRGETAHAEEVHTEEPTVTPGQEGSDGADGSDEEKNPDEVIPGSGEEDDTDVPDTEIPGAEVPAEDPAAPEGTDVDGTDVPAEEETPAADVSPAPSPAESGTDPAADSAPSEDEDAQPVIVVDDEQPEKEEKPSKKRSSKASAEADAEKTGNILDAGSDGSSGYDPRPDRVSQIRDQYWGTCWAQAGISGFESFLIAHGMEDHSYQLSVEDVLWWARGTSYGDEGGWRLQTRDESGYPPATAGYLTTVGGRLESDIPYLGEPSDGNRAGSLIYGEGENQKPVNYDSAAVQYEVTDLIYLNSASQNTIQQLIVSYGAVSASMFASEDNENFNPDTSAVWTPSGVGEQNHAISVVGWDDGFKKENFKKQNGKLPENDGAWIIKNSLGTNYGSDGGFIYISYEDSCLFHNENEYLNYLYCVAGARRPSGQKQYINDQFGAVKSIEVSGSEAATWANVFDFGEGEKINELSFVSWSQGSSYKMYYAPMNGDAPNADQSTWKLLSEGTIEHAGYTTVESGLDEAVPKGKGAIIFSVSGGTPSVGTDEPILDPSGRKSLFNPIQDKGTAFTLQGGKFVATEVERTGGGGYKYMETPDLSIRAYTVSFTPAPTEEPTVTPTPEPTVKPTVSPTVTETPVRPSAIPAMPSRAPLPPSGRPGSSTANANAYTGDESPVWLYVILIAAGAGALITAVVIRRKRTDQSSR